MIKIKLSLVIPAYNEEEILESSLLEIISYLKKRKYKWEIIVADDGSKDKTSEIAKKFAKKNVRLVTLKQNAGKGAALRKGMLAAKGDYIIFTDADLSVPITKTQTLLEELETGKDVVICSRRLKKSNILVHQPFLREQMGKVFTLLTRIYLLTSITDFTCGFKGFTKESSKEIFGKARINRWAYDSELIYLAKKYKFSIKQVPTAWSNRSDSRVQVGMATVTSFTDLLKIRYYDLRGYYG